MKICEINFCNILRQGKKNWGRLKCKIIITIIVIIFLSAVALYFRSASSDANKAIALITMASANCWPESHKEFDSFAWREIQSADINSSK